MTQRRDLFNDREQPLYQGLNAIGGWNALRSEQPIHKVTRLCRGCRRDLYPDQFSMHQTVAGRSEDLSCNTCRATHRANRLFLRNTVQPVDWRRANCRGQSDTESHNLFFGDDKELGKKLCADCPIASQCLSYGQDTRSVGLWGGHELLDGKLGIKPPKTSSACRRGHQRTEENTRVAKSGFTECLDCVRGQYARRKAARQQAAA
jgi:hypothetical protein